MSRKQALETIGGTRDPNLIFLQARSIRAKNNADTAFRLCKVSTLKRNYFLEINLANFTALSLAFLSLSVLRLCLQGIIFRQFL